MPNTLTDLTEKVQDQVLEAVKAGQEVVVQSVQNISGTVSRVLPATARHGLATNLPAATEVVDSAFEFAGRVLETQHGFITRMLDAAAPKTEAAASPRAPKAPKTTAA